MSFALLRARSAPAFLGAAAVLAATSPGNAAPATAELTPPPVAAPEGHRWVLHEQLSDEFDGDALDSTKWNDQFPGWKGRVPGLFVPEAVSVQDGELQIRVGVLDPPRGDKKQWTVQCGAVQSKEPVASYGYYEARIRASDVRTSTTFWMKHRGHGKGADRKSTELDILECVGNAEKWPGFAKNMMSNTHIEYAPAADGTKREGLKVGGRSPVGGRVADDFHVYGCWWVNPTTMRFFLDGKEVHTIELPTENDPAPMNQPMFLNMVCETYNWEVPPAQENLRDDSRNMARYDYVRVWTLEEVE